MLLETPNSNSSLKKIIKRYQDNYEEDERLRWERFGISELNVLTRDKKLAKTFKNYSLGKWRNTYFIDVLSFFCDVKLTDENEKQIYVKRLRPLLRVIDARQVFNVDTVWLPKLREYKTESILVAKGINEYITTEYLEYFMNCGSVREIDSCYIPSNVSKKVRNIRDTQIFEKFCIVEYGNLLEEKLRGIFGMVNDKWYYITGWNYENEIVSTSFYWDGVIEERIRVD